MRDVHKIAAEVRTANARNVARGMRRRYPVRKIVATVTGISGFLMAMAVEQNLWLAAPALLLVAVTFIIM